VQELRKTGKVKGTANPVTGREGLLGCETSRFLHFLDNQFTDGGEVVSFMRWPPFTPKKILGTHFCQRLSQPQGLAQLDVLSELKNEMTSSGNQTRNFPSSILLETFFSVTNI
jgi:hypothetical protein